MREMHLLSRIRTCLATKWPLIVMWIMVLAFAVFFSYLAVMKHEGLQSKGFDLGNFDQAIWNTAHGRPFEFTNWQGKENWFRIPTRLGMHVEPILLLIAPLYWLWDNVWVLLILQAVVVALGGVGIWLLAQWRYRKDAGGTLSTAAQWASLALVAVFLLNPLLQSALLVDFHGVTLVAGLIPFAIYFMLRRRYGWFILFALLIAMTKEEMPLMVALMGLYILIFQGWRGKEKEDRKKAFWVGGSAFMLGLAWTATAFLVIMPYFNSVGASPYVSHYGYASHFSEVLENGGISLRTIPQLILILFSIFLKPDALTYIAGLLLPVAFLALFDLPLLLIGSASLSINILSTHPAQHLLALHYITPLVPIITLATVTGIANLTRRLRNDAHPLAHWLPERLRKAPVGQWHLILALVALLFTLGVQVDRGFTPLSRTFRWPVLQAHHHLAQRFFDQIPPDASVSTQQLLNPHLTHRRQITILPFDRSGEYYLIDITRDWDLGDVFIHQWLLDNIAHAPGYGIVDAADGFMLLRSGAPQQAIPSEFFDLFRAQDAEPQFPAQIDFGDAVRFLGFDVNQGDGSDPTFDLYFQPLQDLDRDYFITLYLADESYELRGAVEATQPALLWFPTSRWGPGDIVKIPFRHLPWDVSELDSYSVALGVLDGEDVWAQDQRLEPVVDSFSQNPRLSNGDTLLHLMRFRRDQGYTESLPDPVLESPPADATPANIAFGDLASLEGYSISPDSLSPGDKLDLMLYWRALAATEVSYTVFTQLLGPDGQLHGQHDSPPGYDTLPSNRWQPDQLLPDEHRLLIAPNAPVGDYQLLIGFYNPDDGQRIPLADGSGDYYAIPLLIGP